MADNPALQKARAVRHAVKVWREKHPGKSVAQARHALGLAPSRKSGKRSQSTAMVRVTETQAVEVRAPRKAPPSRPQPKTTVVYLPSPEKPHRRRQPREGMVPTADCNGVTTRGGASISAKFTGHTVVVFDGRTVGAALSGFLRQLTYGQTQTLPSMFPELYPLQAAAQQAQCDMVQERQLGAEMAKILGAALRAYGITPVQWAQYYVESLASAPPLPPAVVGPVGQVQGGGQQLLAPGQQPAMFGSPLGQPSMVTDPFGTGR